MLTMLWIAFAFAVIIALAYVSARGVAWTVTIAAFLGAAWMFSMVPAIVLLPLAGFLITAGFTASPQGLHPASGALQAASEARAADEAGGA